MPEFMTITSNAAILRSNAIPIVKFDDAYFETVVDLHYKRVYNLIYRMIQSEADAADLTQETFVRVYKALPRLRAEGAQSA